MDSEQIDSKSAGQILLQEIRRAHEQGNFFMDSSGNVDTQKFNQVKTSITRDVENGKYDNLIQRNQKEAELKVNENENKQIDLNTPEGKKEFINNLYKGYSECKTLEDKKNYIQNDFGISLEGMSDEQIENVVSAFDTRQDIRSIKDKLDKETIKKENPNLDDETFDKLLEDMAEEQYAEESGRDLEEVKAVNSEMVKLEELLAEKRKLIHDKQDFSDIQKQIDEICDKLKLSPEELIEIQNENENKVENTGNLNNKEKLDIIEEKLEISDSFENEEISTDQGEDLSDFFDIEENQLENDEEILDLLDAEVSELNSNSDTRIEEAINESHINENVNSIIANVPEEDFEQSYEEEIKENPIVKFFKDMRNRLTQKKLTEGQVEKVQQYSNELNQEDYTQDVKPAFLERAKNALSNLIHRNKKDVYQIDTAENNTKAVEMKQDGVWELSNYGTSREEVNQNIAKAGEQSKKKQNSAEKATQIESGESISI